MALTDKQKKLVDTILADERYSRYPRSVIEFIVQFDSEWGADWIKQRERKQRKTKSPKDSASKDTAQPVFGSLPAETVEYGLVVRPAPEASAEELEQVLSLL